MTTTVGREGGRELAANGSSVSGDMPELLDIAVKRSDQTHFSTLTTR
jgi:hypothetical protein